MLDIKFVRENPDAIDTAMANRQTSWDREKFFELDDERRAVVDGPGGHLQKAADEV